MKDKSNSLFERVGGDQGVARLVESFYARVLEDARIKDFFTSVSMEKLKKMQHEFFSLALGEPGKYSDIDLFHSHHGKGIETRHFVAFIENMFATLAEINLSESDRYQIISTLNTYVDDITEDSQAGVL